MFYSLPLWGGFALEWRVLERREAGKWDVLLMFKYFRNINFLQHPIFISQSQLNQGTFHSTSKERRQRFCDQKAPKCLITKRHLLTIHDTLALECVFFTHTHKKLNRRPKRKPMRDTLALRACLHGGGGPQVGEVTRLGGVTRLSI